MLAGQPVMFLPLKSARRRNFEPDLSLVDRVIMIASEVCSVLTVTLLSVHSISIFDISMLISRDKTVLLMIAQYMMLLFALLCS